VAASDQQEVRWHVAQLLPRLDLEESERAAAVATLLGYLDDPSRIVRTFSLEALTDFALRDPRLRPRAMAVLQAHVDAGSPAVRSRGRKLLDHLRKACG
ncbi:MAG: ACT domain-containing protein, partial [Chloroflexota bacterium]|nr:ACT domain-containing protein [Chloroflexota bacterium]